MILIKPSYKILTEIDRPALLRRIEAPAVPVTNQKIKLQMIQLRHLSGKLSNPVMNP